MKRTLSWSIIGSFFGEAIVEQIPEVCRRVGFAGIEGTASLPGGKTDAELRKIRERFDSFGLAIPTFHLPYGSEDDIASFYETVRIGAVERMKRWLSHAAVLGVETCIQHPTPDRHSVDVEGPGPSLRQLSASR